MPIDKVDLLATARVVSIPLRNRFRGIDVRETLVFEGPNGWAEWGPLTEYGTEEASTWLRAAIECAFEPRPTPLRTEIGINATLADVAPELVTEALKPFGNFRTVKIKVGAGSIEADLKRIETVVREYDNVKIRLDANTLWSVDQARFMARSLADRGIEIEYFEQPCATIEELIELRVGLIADQIVLKIAADELVRKAADPMAVVRAGAADLLILKVAPMGGIERLLRVAAESKLPVVISSALETSIGISNGLHAAACLPVLEHDCGLGTIGLFEGDIVTEPLLPIDGKLQLTKPTPDEQLLNRYAASEERTAWWLKRLETCANNLGL